MTDTTATVLAMPGITRPDRDAAAQPNPKVIAYLEKILDRAKAGEVQSVAMAFVRANGYPSYGWHGFDGVTQFALHSGLMTMLTAIENEMDAVSTSDDDNLSNPDES